MIIKQMTYYLQDKLEPKEEIKLWMRLLRRPKVLALLNVCWLLSGKPDHRKRGLIIERKK